jgi:hypothetical protein
MKKESAKIFGIVLISLLALISVANLVAAETNLDVWKVNFANALDQLHANPYYSTLILLGVLLWIILFTIIKQMFNYESTTIFSWGFIAPSAISLIMVILTFMFIPQSMIEAIALQYTAMGAAILTVIPFAIMLYFTLNVLKSTMASRILWIFYIIYYFLIFIYKIAMSTVPFTTAVAQPENWPYVGAIIAGIIIFAFTKNIKDLVYKGKLSDAEERANEEISLRATNRRVEDREARERFNPRNVRGL